MPSSPPRPPSPSRLRTSCSRSSCCEPRRDACTPKTSTGEDLMLQPRTARRSRTPLLALLAVALVAACSQGPSPNSKDRSPSPSPSPLALPTPLPPGFTAPGTDASPPRPTLLLVVPATGLKVGALHQAAFPDRTQAGPGACADARSRAR